MISLIVTGEKH